MRIELTSARPPTYVRRPRQWIGVVATIGIIAVAASTASRVGVPPALAAGVALAFLVLIRLSELAWRRRYRHRSPVRRDWVITDDEIRVSGAGSSRAWRWPAVVAVDEHRDVYLLRQDNGIALDIPRPALTSAQDGDLRAFLANRGLLPPGII